MITREIQVSTQTTACDVCGRNLLRGEYAERYVGRGKRHLVCDLCASRVLQDGWVREGTLPPYEPGDDERQRRRPLLSRLRARLGGLLSDGERMKLEEDAVSPEQKVSCAIRAFNGSEHTRTIAGVARALGPPDVTIRTSEMDASVVRVVAAWELCWYRYEVDLADELPNVRVAARGAELDELGPIERESNASADADGAIALGR